VTNKQLTLPGFEKIPKVSSSDAPKPTTSLAAITPQVGELDEGVTQTPAQMLSVLAINLPDHTAQVWEKDGIQYASVKVT